MFGDDGRVSCYLPPGRWTSPISGKLVDGGGWRTETHGYIAIGKGDSRPDYDYADGVSFHLFEPVDGAESAAHVVSAEGREGARKPWSLCLRNVPSVSSVGGGAAEARPEATLIPADFTTA